MGNIAGHRKAVVERVLRGPGRASTTQREAAFSAPVAPLLDKVAQHAYRVTADDIAAAKASGLTEDQIFELVVCAALGQATRQLEAALAALAAATKDA
jgi:hypothetical protein